MGVRPILKFKSKKPEDQKFPIDLRMIIILSAAGAGGTQRVEVRASAKFPRPLNIIKYEDVEEVEWIGDAKTIEQFICIDFYDEYLASV